MITYWLLWKLGDISCMMVLVRSGPQINLSIDLERFFCVFKCVIDLVLITFSSHGMIFFHPLLLENKSLDSNLQYSIDIRRNQ